MRKAKVAVAIAAQLDCLAVVAEQIRGCATWDEIDGWIGAPDDDVERGPQPLDIR